ncbi:insulinase family protein [Clostridium sp. AWRP]|uniref:insulinase family protein n=1 Tax=Clostridium sp. AWRP TaxID=2212991 RepID=UPI000FDBE99B|nr:insulinase family protein [Clostridium sp. AWRP]AZV56552.1 peptidase M16 [Clostridium sp. AWRP]
MRTLKMKIVLLLAFVFMFQCSSFDTVFAAANSNENTFIDLTVGNSYFGFKVLSKTYIKDIDSTVYELEHEKTGGKVCYMKNNDNYKVFSVAFKTLPKDSTGVNHIIEHVIAEEQRHNNGMFSQGNSNTDAKFTYYHGADLNEEKFETAMKGTLNSVFFPNINENLMKQEGWRYDISSPSDELKVNGIVYNEEKGRKSPYEVLQDKIEASLFPNSAQFDSGGNPEDIPKLTYKELLETYKKNYTPSNSLICLYGNLDITKILESINNNYFSKFNKTASIDTSTKYEKVNDKMAFSEGYYSLPKGSSVTNKTYLSLNYALGNDLNKETLGMLENILSSPLEKAFSDNNLGHPIWVGDNPFSITAEGANESQKEKFQTVVNSTLQNIVKNGFDKELVNSKFNEYEMDQRKESSSALREKIYVKDIIEAWCENESIEQSLLSISKIENIKEKYKKDNRYFENLIQKYILNNTHSSLVVMKPKPGLDDENESKLKDSLAKYKASLSLNQINELINQNKAFKSWQDDYSKQTSKNNSVDLNTVNKKSEEIPSEVSDYNGVKILKHPIYTAGLQYINLYFDTSKIPQDKLMYLVLLTKILGNVGTQNYTYDKLSNAVGTNTGGITFYPDNPSLECPMCDKDSDKYYPKLKVSMLTLNNNLQNSFNILQEITNSSNFSDKDGLKSLIKKVKSDMQNDINNDPYIFVAPEALSYSSDSGKYYNIYSLPFYNFICDLDKNFDKQSDEVIKNLNYVKNLTFNKNNLIVSYTGDDSDYGNFVKCFDTFFNKINGSNGNSQKYTFDYSSKNEAFITPAQVQCIVKSGNYKKLGYKPSGKMVVFGTIVQSYLTQKLRRKGGAYSVGVERNNSDFSFYSTSDPNLKNTIDTFNTVPDYLKNFNPDKNEMNKYILASLKYIDTLRDPEGKASEADNMYIMGITQEDVQKYRDEILSTTADDIRNYAPMMDAIMKQNNLCVSGNENIINSNKALFQSIKNLCYN